MFEIDGYWKDNKKDFKGYLVHEQEFEDCPKDIDDDAIFFYGLSETVLQQAIKDKQNTIYEFVITGYRKQ